jgi:hypothetical protein
MLINLVIREVLFFTRGEGPFLAKRGWVKKSTITRSDMNV